MTLALALSPRVKLARSTAVRNDIDAATTPGKIKLYALPRPAPGGTPVGDLLAVITLTDPCGTVDSTGLHLTAFAAGQAVATGAIGWGRVCDGDGNWVIDGGALPASDPDVALAPFVLDAMNVFTGGYVNLVSATLVEGG
jgi:hypothetical protein